MNRTAKIVLTVGIACCLLGGIFYGIGKYTGGENYVRNTDMDSFDGEDKGEIIQLDKKKLEDFQAIEVDFDSLDLVVKPSDDDSCYLSYRLLKGKKKDPLLCEVEGDTLKLKEDGTETSFYVHVDLNFLTHIGDGMEDVDIVTLYVPKEKIYEDCKFVVRDGDVQMEQLKSKNTDIKLSSGDLSLKKLDFDACTVVSEDGDIYFSESPCKELQIDSGSGDVLFRDMELPKLVVRMKDGDLEAKGITVSGEAEIENKSGDVDIRFAGESGDHTEIKAYTKNGDLETAGSLKGTKKSDDYGDFCEYEKRVKKAAGHLNINCSDGDIILY